MNTPTHFDPYDINVKQIDSVPVYYKHTPWAPCIHIEITFKTGSLSDPVGKEGLSHFLEHMIFDGSPSLPDRKAVQAWKKKYTLNSWNAYTGHYQTTYHLRTLPENFSQTLSGMWEQIFSPLLTTADVEHERQVITQEAWNRFKNQKLLSYIKEKLSQIFPGHNKSRMWSPLGWPETIQLITDEDIRVWHKEKYHKGNMYIAIGGCIDDAHLEMLKTYIEALPTQDILEQKTEETPTPLTKEFIKSADDIGLVQERVDISVSTYTKKPTFPFQHGRLFNSVVYDILHERLREEQPLCYSIHVGAGKQLDLAYFDISVKTSEESIEQVRSIIAKELELIISTDTYKDRFDQIKQTATDQIKSEEHDTESIVGYASAQVVLQNPLESVAQSLAIREATTYEDIQKAGAYLTNPLYTVTEVILPSKK